MSYRPDDDEEYKRSFSLMRKDDQMAFRVFIISTNTEAYNDESKTASEWFLSWDALEDAMPFLTEPAIEVDIRWSESNLEQKVKELGLEKGQTVILINPSQLEVIPEDSAVLGDSARYGPSAISSLLDPTRVVMDTTMSNVREVGDWFLYECSSLEELYLKGIHSLQKVGTCFLRNCSSLKKVDLKGFFFGFIIRKQFTRLVYFSRVAFKQRVWKKSISFGLSCRIFGNVISIHNVILRK